MDLRFISKNKYKTKEVEALLRPKGISIKSVPEEIEELQTENVDRLVKDKVIKAFNILGRPLFVEHTGLYLRGLNGFPGGLTQIFWDRLEADRFTKLVSGLGDNTVEAKTVIGYCDGKKIYLFEGAITGTVPQQPAGDRKFQWDCVFIPDGYECTFAQMGDDKNNISMRKKAFEKFSKHLSSEMT